MKSIIQIKELIDSLTPSDKQKFERIFEIQKTTSRFKSKPAQTTIKISDKVIGQETFFNETRQQRPRPVLNNFQLEKFIQNQKNKDPFCQPKEKTPEDIFGRIETKHALTAKNANPFSKHHGLIIFKEHHPLKFNLEQFLDYLKIAKLWFEKIDSIDAHISWRQIIWNTMPRAGASQVHGHMQILADERPTAWLVSLEIQTEAYQNKYRSNYFQDLFLCHQKIGLAQDFKKIKLIIQLTPSKEKGILFMAEDIGPSQIEIIYKVLRVLLDELKVESFNMVFEFKFIGASNLPGVLIKFVDRGKNQDATSDFGALEALSRTSVVSTDPFWLADNLFSKI